MSSTDNLMSLLNQLQTLESTVTEFLMETILRFRHLTDAKVFLLIERRQGMESQRRYCGSDELIQNFHGGNLFQRPSDCLVELDTNAKVLIDTQQQQQQSSKRQISGNKVMNGWTMPSTSETIENRYHQQSSPPKKRKYSIDNDNSAEFHDSDRSSRDPNSNFYNNIKEEVEDCVVIESEDGNGDQLDEPLQDDLDDRYEHLEAPSAFADPNDVDASGIEMKDILTKECRSNQISVFFDRLKSPELQEQKLMTVLATDNPFAAYVKQTTEYKVWRSVLYQVGKNIAFNCPFANKSFKTETARDYFSGQVEIFMTHCSRLLVDKEKRPKVAIPENDCLHGLSVVGFIRHSIRHGYLYALKHENSHLN